MLETKIKNIEIGYNTQFLFPHNIGIEKIDNKFVIISIDSGNWIITNNKTELEIFLYLKDHNIGETIKYYPTSQKEIQTIVAQIIAKKFCDKEVNETRINTIQLHLTNACNLRCPYCYMSSGKRHNEELSFDEFKYIILAFSKASGERVIYTGGEPLLFPQLKELLKYAKSLHLKNEILSNGTLWNNELITELYPFVDSIQISIDGVNEKTNSITRSEGSYDRALNTVKTFLQYNITTQISVTPFINENEENILNYVKWAEKLKSMFPTKNFRVVFNSQLLPGRNMEYLKNISDSYSESINKIYSLLYGVGNDYNLVKAFKERRLNDNCGFGNLCITSNGDVYFCSKITSSNISQLNVRTTDINKIFKLSEKAKKFSHVNNLLPCSKCSLKNICGGGCRIDYFKNFCNDISFNSHPERICSKKEKEKLLQSMIRVNKILYR